MRTFILLALCFLLSACATGSLSSSNSKQWQGRHVDDLQAKKGAPSMKTPIAGGNVNYIYTIAAPSVYSQPQNPQVTTLIGPNGQTVAVSKPFMDMRAAPSLTSCIETYEVNKNGIIVNVSLRGDC